MGATKQKVEMLMNSDNVAQLADHFEASRKRLGRVRPPICAGLNPLPATAMVILGGKRGARVAASAIPGRSPRAKWPVPRQRGRNGPFPT